ncbi:MAG: tetratricopeptide repeat protein [Bdellovibrionales bacterium]|nr:tetratricopeptide repeat protein [Bdellovibrionales bacterium]
METNFESIPLTHTNVDKFSQDIMGEMNSCINEKQFSKAAQIAKNNIEKMAKNSSFLVVAARAFKANQDYKTEAECLHMLVSIDPQPRYQILLAESLSAQGDFPSAIKVLHQVLDETQGATAILFEVYKNMGNIYLKCGDIEAAEEKYHKANRINPNDESLNINYGVLAIQKGLYEEAKERFSIVVCANGKNDLGWVGLALVHRAHGDFDLARACLLRALDENPFNKMAIIHFYQWCNEEDIEPNFAMAMNYMSAFPDDIEIQKLVKGMNN